MTGVPNWFRRPLAEGDRGNDVAVVQRMLGLHPTGVFDAALGRKVRGLQAGAGIVQSGEVDAGTAAVLGESVTSALVPAWWSGPLGPGASGVGVRVLRGLLGLPDGELFDRATEDAVRRLQSARGVEPDGVVGERVALWVGDVEIEL